MTDCVFCDIVAGRAPASIVQQDQTALTIMTIGPVNPGHALVLPKRHATYLADLDEETGAHLFRVAMRVAAAIRRSDLRGEGVNFFLADGAAAFQEVFHVHLHVFPRFAGDAFRIHADWSFKPTRDEFDEVAARIGRAYDALDPTNGETSARSLLTKATPPTGHPERSAGSAPAGRS